MEWDTPITGELLDQWNKLINGSESAQPLVIPRYYFKGVDNVSGVYSLQGFCDASLYAYAAIVYLRLETPTDVYTQFVASKTRVSPIKGQSIPRLELLAAVLLSRLIHSISNAYWIRHSQLLLSEKECFQSWETQLGIYSDERVLLRCQGRLDNAELPYVTKHPILLDSKHHITELIVKDCHLAIKHGGVKETLTELRSQYWIVHGRNFVRKLIGQCITCHKFGGKPYSAPSFPPLPDFRVTQLPPFMYTGVDFAGPLHVSDSEKKIWLCLYTCAVSRAVHLEVVPGLSTQIFLLCFRRFSSRRGLPQQMISNNAKTFKTANSFIKGIKEDPVVKKYFSNIHLTWSFNLEKAPWQGGIFERLIQSAKRCLKCTIGTSKLSYDELVTVVTEVELVLNSRPLTYVSTEDIEEPLAPSHLITGRRLLSLPSIVHDEAEDPEFVVHVATHTELNKRFNHLNIIIDHFWNRWRKEYLCQLRETHFHSRKQLSASNNITVGEVVLVHDDNHPRSFWKLAHVKKLLTSSDGVVEEHWCH